MRLRKDITKKIKFVKILLLNRSEYLLYEVSIYRNIFEVNDINFVIVFKFLGFVFKS